MDYIVYGYLDGRWTVLLSTGDLDHAKAFRQGIKGVKTKIEERGNDNDRQRAQAAHRRPQ